MAGARSLLWAPVAAAAAGLLAATGCSGQIHEPEGGVCETATAGDAPLRRLTHDEYNNTVRDLLGDATRPADAFPTDTSQTGFDNQASALTISPILAEHYMLAAESLAAAAVADTSALVPCDPTGDEDACARAFIAELGLRAFRRPLADAEVDRLFALFATGRDDEGFDRGVELVLQAVLQSPKFLFRVEYGAPAGGPVAPLSSYEMASRLSYFLWASMPDTELFDAAAADALATREQVADQARRMLADPRARTAVAAFHEQWLRLSTLEVVNKDASLFPEFDDDYKQWIAEETLAFLDHLVFDGGGSFRTMFLAEFSFRNPELAAIYGEPAPSGTGFERTAVDTSHRVGLLGHASILSVTSKRNQTSPILRGKLVREQFLCNTMPEPPPNVDTTPPDVSPDATTRERFAQHTADPACRSCHEYLDPIGFGLEHFDPIGRWRGDENGLPIDATGELVDVDGTDTPFDGVHELAALLADSEQAHQCFVDQWFTFAHGRAPTAGDDCSVSYLADQFSGSDYDIMTLLVELTQTDAFRYRSSL
jgi:hypothetical protein